MQGHGERLAPQVLVDSQMQGRAEFAYLIAQMAAAGNMLDKVGAATLHCRMCASALLASNIVHTVSAGHVLHRDLGLALGNNFRTVDTLFSAHFSFLARIL